MLSTLIIVLALMCYPYLLFVINMHHRWLKRNKDMIIKTNTVNIYNNKFGKYTLKTEEKEVNNHATRKQNYKQ